MANIQSNIARFQTSSPHPREQPEFLLTTVTQRRPVQSHPSAPQAAALFTLPKEPEDARLTGGTRSLDRRLLALNLSGSRPGGLSGIRSGRQAA
jgi:hypothetical protein